MLCLERVYFIFLSGNLSIQFLLLGVKFVRNHHIDHDNVVALLVVIGSQFGDALSGESDALIILGAGL